MTSYTDSSIKIVESCDDDNCSLDWQLKSDDNNDPSCYLVGTPYKIRLYKVPQTLNEIVFNTNGSINFDEIIEKSVENEYIIFSGEQAQELNFPFISDFSYTLIGNAYSEDGAILPTITFSVFPGRKRILASIPCFAVLKSNYTTQYSYHSFIGASVGETLLIAMASCGNDSVESAISIDIKSCCDDEECLPISIVIDTETDRGANYDNENKKLIRVYGAERNQISVKATKGNIEFLGPNEDTIEETLAGCNGNFNASKFVSNLITQETINGNIKPFVVERGSLRMAISPEDGEANRILPGYGVVKIKYISRYLEFLITSSDLTKGVFYITNSEDEDCEIVCIEYDLGGEGDGINRYDITVIYRDFVTGAPIPQNKVWVDDKYIGATNDAGELLIENVTSNTKHLIRAEKPGYLNTDSDSLANDSFIIYDD